LCSIAGCFPSSQHIWATSSCRHTVCFLCTSDMLGWHRGPAVWFGLLHAPANMPAVQKHPCSILPVHNRYGWWHRGPAVWFRLLHAAANMPAVQTQPCSILPVHKRYAWWHGGPAVWLTLLHAPQSHLSAMQTQAHSMLLCHSRDAPRGTGACCVLLDSSLHKSTSQPYRHMRTVRCCATPAIRLVAQGHAVCY
jgi:hypothetical protein